jgi:ubiquitin carboxyl-terminal hydrolase 4/11/15
MPGSTPIVRIAHNTNSDRTGIPNIIYEFHPPIFTIHRLHNANINLLLPQILKAKNPEAPIVVASRSDNYIDFLRKIKTSASIDTGKKVRVWRVPRAQPAAEPSAPISGAATPPSSRPTTPETGVAINPGTGGQQDAWRRLLLDVTVFNKLERGSGRELIDMDDHTANQNYNGKSDLAFVGLGDDQAIVLDEKVDNAFVSTYVPKKGGLATGRNTGTSSSYIPSSQNNSGRNSPAPYNTRGRTKAAGRTLGTVGLSNLGNTCYMNSALQCIRSVEELTKYFLTGVAATELNRDNPLGNHGEVASAYNNLLHEMYRDNVTTYSPRSFKNTIGRFAPSFSGYGQQDSQEFLGFLLDGLQEDLSRVKKKPYIEKPDSTDEMVNNPEAIREMAAKVWDITKKRDDSVIADLFTGMYKSTLVCPICAKVSITFDPFNNVTLQLPIENTWSHDIFFFPLNDKPIIISVDLDKQGSILAMKQYMSKKVGIPPERLFVAEEFKSKIYKIHDDWEQASEVIGNNDTIAIYELECKPTNWPAPKKPTKKPKAKSVLNFGNSTYGNDSDDEDLPSWHDPLAKKMLVPVFHRRPNTARSAFKHPWVFAPVPHFIIVTPEEVSQETSYHDQQLLICSRHGARTSSRERS